MRKCSLSDIADIVDCEHKTAPKVTTSSFYSIRTTDISNGKIIIENANRVSEETYREWTKRAVPSAGDIILAREAPVGEVGWINDGYMVCLGQRTVLVKVTDKDVSNRYLLYYFVNPDTKHELQVRSVGSVVSHLNMKDIRSFEVALPKIEEQKSIASILSSLDDKIDLLHRQNKTLEAMAETLFRQWFVEGVREDWKEDTLGSIVEFNYGKSLNDKDRSGFGFPVMGSSGVVGLHENYLVEAPGIVTGRKGTLGVINYMFENFYPIDTTFYITSKIDSVGLYYEYFLLKNSGLSNMNSDSAVPGLNRNAAHAIPLMKPPMDIISNFNQFCKPLFQKIRLNTEQKASLEKLRDTLLPKLMSGEVRVS